MEYADWKERALAAAAADREQKRLAQKTALLEMISHKKNLLAIELKTVLGMEIDPYYMLFVEGETGGMRPIWVAGDHMFTYTGQHLAISATCPHCSATVWSAPIKNWVDLGNFLEEPSCCDGAPEPTSESGQDVIPRYLHEHCEETGAPEAELRVCLEILIDLVRQYGEDDDYGRTTCTGPLSYAAWMLSRHGLFESDDTDHLYQRGTFVKPAPPRDVIRGTVGDIPVVVLEVQDGPALVFQDAYDCRLSLAEGGPARFEKWQTPSPELPASQAASTSAAQAILKFHTPNGPGSIWSDKASALLPGPLEDMLISDEIGVVLYR